ncbi:hypothetical protein FRC03_009651 [Tulasnella sp. 419]|nr:hypothetical protein FRC02_006315 [Tulasnella sp. 418]KAG8967622.1 hypothetical protein FRC03_009651 [Tulasnella sp. 419]
MHPALESPKLITRILEFTDDRTRCTAARICKTWNGPALDLIWYAVPSLRHLAKILSPLTVEYNSELSQHEDVLSELPTKEAWLHALELTRRVKVLEHNHGGEDGVGLGRSVILHMILYCPVNRRLFPNLEKLSWTFSFDPDEDAMNLIPILMSTTTKTLEVICKGPLVKTDRVQFFLRQLPIICGESNILSHLLLDFRTTAVNLEQDVVNLIDSFPKLKGMELPHCYYTEKIVKALGSHESLTIIKGVDRNDAAQDVDLYGVHVQFQEGWFKNVEYIRLDTTLAEGIKLFQNPHRPPKLIKVGISTLQKPIDPEELKTFLEALATALPDLVWLGLNHYHKAEDSSASSSTEEQPADDGEATPTPAATTDGPAAAVDGAAASTDQTTQPSTTTPAASYAELKNKRLSFGHLRPLLKCRKLRRFHISHNLPLDFTPEDVRELLDSWPQIDHLELCSDPLVVPDMISSTMPLSIFSTFAERCPNLIYLSLYLDMSSFQSIQSKMPDLTGLKNLETLHFGTSLVTDVFKTAEFFVKMTGGNDIFLGFGGNIWHSSACGLTSEVGQRNGIWWDVDALVKHLRRYFTTLKSLKKGLVRAV